MTTSVDQKLLRQMKFPPQFNKKVDMQKVNIEVMKKWIVKEISEITPDDTIPEFLFSLLEESRFPDIKKIQYLLSGFLEDKNAAFCEELWNLCLSAQESPQGVPQKLLEMKKQELAEAKAKQERFEQEESARFLASDRAIDRSRDEIRQAGPRGAGRGRDREWRGGRRGGRGASPGYRRRRDSSTDHRGGRVRLADSYMPARDRVRRRRESSASVELRSLSRSLSRSRSPPAHVRRPRSPRSRSPPARNRHPRPPRSRSPPIRDRRARSPRSRSPPGRDRRVRSPRSRSPPTYDRRARSPRSRSPPSRDRRACSPGSPRREYRRSSRSRSGSPPHIRGERSRRERNRDRKRSRSYSLSPSRSRSRSRSPKRRYSRRERSVSNSPPRRERRESRVESDDERRGDVEKRAPSVAGDGDEVRE